MKKIQTRIIAATAEPMTGSPSASYGGVDIGSLYIDMLCDQFKNRGIKTGLNNRVNGDRIAKEAEKLGLIESNVSPDDSKYRTMKVDGKAYMSCDDFAAYYKDLRGYRLPNFYSRAEKEYEEAEADKVLVQESGKPPKKAIWLAVKSRTKNTLRDLFETFIRDEYRRQSEEMLEGEKKKLPKGILTSLILITLSLLLIVCSTVMVSRASLDLSRLEYQIENLESVRDDLNTDLEVKNNMLNIKEIAVKEYGMISGDYAASRYLDLLEDEVINVYDGETGNDSLIIQLLKAIGLIKD